MRTDGSFPSRRLRCIRRADRKVAALGDESEDGGVFEGGVVFGIEIGDGLADLESMVGEDGGEFVCFEPVDAFGAFVGFEELAFWRVERVTVIAGEEAVFRIDGVFCFDGGAGFVGEDEVAVRVPFVLGDLAFEFGVGNEGGEVEPAIGLEDFPDGEEEAGGVGDELEGEGGNAEGGVGLGEIEGFDFAVVEGGVQTEGFGFFAAELEHIGGEVEPFDVEAGGEEGEEEAAGAATEFEGAAGM